MPKRNLHVVHASDPLFAVCEHCNARFKSFAAKAEDAEKEVQAQFTAHKCHPVDFHLNAGRKESN